jgi:hypothetical protein
VAGYETIYVTYVTYYDNDVVSGKAGLSLRLVQALTLSESILLVYNVTVGTSQLGSSSDDNLYSDLVAAISTACSGADSEFVTILKSNDESGVYQIVTVPDKYSTVSTYSTVFVHSPAPTSVPSLSPTCGLGSFGDDESACQLCPPGTYGSSIGLERCTLCPMNFHSNDPGSIECSECKWPFSTCKTGSDRCGAIYLDIHGAWLVSPIVIVVLVTLLGLWSVPNNRLMVTLILLFPTIDIVTDLLYLLHTRFHDVYLFGTCILFLFMSSSTFIYILVQEKLYPRFYGKRLVSLLWWIGVSDGYPTVYGKIKVTSLSNHDSLPKAFYLFICWITAVCAQCISAIPLVTFFVVHCAFYVFWLMVGALLFQMKMIAVGPVLNFWVFIWSDNLLALKHFEEKQVINATYFNIASANSLILETLPQLLIQCVNSSLVSNWSTIGAVSIAMSGIL